MAPTLSKKSTASTKGVCRVKNDCRDCRTDQRTSADYGKVSVESLGEVNRLTGATAVT